MTDFTTIGAELFRAAADSGDVEAIVDGDLRMTWSEVAQHATAFAKACIAAGIEPGDKVSIWAPNSARWVIAQLGLHCAGAVLVPVNTRYKGAEAGYILDASEARMLVVADGFLNVDYSAMLAGAGVTLDNVHVVTMTGPGTDGIEPWEAFLSSGESVSDTDFQSRLNAVASDALADILFTSGTTGKPKGVMITHKQNLLVNERWANAVGLELGDRYLLINPMFHSFGYRAGIIASLIKRATMVVMAVFDVPQALELAKAESITVMPGAPTLYISMLNDTDRDPQSLATVRLAVTGGAVVPVALIERIKTELGIPIVISAYGMTESCGTISVCPPDAEPVDIATTCGVALPGTQVRIINDVGDVLGPGETGEICVKGPNVMMGYFNNAEATAKTIVDGWLHTGDVGTMDDRGFIKITDRLKDMIVVGGFNVYPAEIENALAKHDKVAEAAVIEKSDERQGEVAYAYIVPRDVDNAPSSDELYAFCRENLANFKVPRGFEIVSDLPRTPSGKVIKPELRAKVHNEA